MRLFFASLAFALGGLIAGPAFAQFQPVQLMCGDPVAPCSASNPLPVGGASGTSNVNVSQINGVTPLMGAGATGTGSHRTTQAQDTTTIAGSAPGTAGTASANVVTIQGIAAMTKLLVTPDANSAINLAQVAGSATATGSGTAAGSLRVELPTNGTGVVGLNAGSAIIGNVRVDQTTPGATNGVSPVAAAAGGASFLNIAAGQATTTVKSGAGTLYAIVLNSAATATNVTTIYDNTAGSGTVIAIPAVTTATIPVTLDFGPTGLAFGTGLTVVTATANGGNMTFVYK